MKKLSLAIIGMYAGILASFSQPADTSQYKSRRLTFEEINFVTGYYWQDGDNSAVTGGTGTEKLTDISNSLQLKLYRYGKTKRKQTILFEIGVDHYTSASSDNI